MTHNLKLEVVITVVPFPSPVPPPCNDTFCDRPAGLSYFTLRDGNKRHPVASARHTTRHTSPTGTSIRLEGGEGMHVQARPASCQYNGVTRHTPTYIHIRFHTRTSSHTAPWGDHHDDDTISPALARRGEAKPIHRPLSQAGRLCHFFFSFLFFTLAHRRMMDDG